MKASLNYTDRQKLVSLAYDIKVVEHINAPSSLQFALNKQHIKNVEDLDDCIVWVEAYTQAKLQRMQLGAFKVVAENDFIEKDLTEFLPGEPLLFRIKIVDHGNHKVRAWKDRINPIEIDVKGNRRSILSVTFKPLNGIIWDIDFATTSGRPSLVVNSKVNPERVKTDPVFAALVFPIVIRDVLRYLLKDADPEEISDNPWIIFAQTYVDAYTPDEADDDKNEELKANWISGVVSEFANQKNLVTCYMEAE